MYQFYCFSFPPDWYVFHVQAQDSDCMNVIGVYGDCLLALTPNFELLCAQAGTKQLLARWPFDCLKSYSHGSGLFSFIAGRHSPHGPGEYGFITGQDKTIHRMVEKLIDKAKRGSVSSGSSSTFSHIDQRAPLPTPGQQPLEQDSPPMSTSSSSGSDADDPASEPQRKRAEQNVYIKSSPTPGEEDLPPQLPSKPPPRLPPKGAAAVSEPSAWLADRYRPGAIGGLSSPEPSPTETPPGGDHVYSRTIHRYPGATSPVPGDDPSIYNSLVREKSTGGTLPVGASRVPSRGKGDYELAYPAIKESHYNTAYTEDGKRASSQSPTSDTQIEAVDMPAPPISGDGNSMTANPLYGSQANILDEIITHPLASPATIELPNISDGIAAMRSTDTTIEGAARKPNDLNPVYVESVLQTVPAPLPTLEPVSASNGAAALSTEKDGKGYTKVSKTSPPASPKEEQSTNRTSESNEQPPPLPERHYDPEQ